MTTVSVSIDRTSLELDPLVIGGTGSDTFTLTESGLGRPGVTPRATTAGDSPWVHGSVTVAAVREQSALPLEVLVQADSDALLEAAIAELDAALWQFAYTVTVTVGGVGQVWAADPAAWSTAGDARRWAYAARFIEVLTVTIPVHPIPGSP